MIAWSTPVVGEAIDWALDSILPAALKELLAAGVAHRPVRYASDDEYIGAMRALVKAQIELLPTGQGRGDVKASTDIQTEAGLIALAKVPRPHRPRAHAKRGKAKDTLSSRELGQLFDSIEDWDRLIDAVRFQPSGRATPTACDSALVIGTFPLVLNGSSLFPVNSPAYPKFIAKLLREQDLLPDDHPDDESPAIDAPAMLIEDGPYGCVPLRVAPCAEGTYFDPEAYAEHFCADVVEGIRAVLDRKLGEGYLADSMTVIRERLIGSVLESAKRAGLPAGRLRFEGGALRAGGLHDDRYRFIGSRLDVTMQIEFGRATAFLSLPRATSNKGRDREHNHAVALGSMTLHGIDCVFHVGGRQRSGGAITWALRHEFDGAPLPRSLEGFVIPRVAPEIVEAGGADPDEVDYAFLQTDVMLGSRPVPVGLVVRSQVGSPMAGWAVLRDDVESAATQAELIAHAEAHERRMAPDGPIHTMVDYIQRAGVQLLKARMPDRRAQREALILVAHLLRQRAAHGI